jgi:hypothetical protein
MVVENQWAQHPPVYNDEDYPTTFWGAINSWGSSVQEVAVDIKKAMKWYEEATKVEPWPEPEEYEGTSLVEVGERGKEWLLPARPTPEEVDALLRMERERELYRSRMRAERLSKNKTPVGRGIEFGRRKRRG